MKKVAILGHSPLPFENVKKNYAPGKRVMDFVRCSIDASYSVLMIASRLPKTYDENTNSIIFQKLENLDYYSIDNAIFQNKKWLKKKISDFKPNCIVGVNTYPASVVAELNLDIPFWADLNGSAMAEAQTKAAAYNDDSHLYHFFKMESKVLTSADIFSTISKAQGYSLVGELGLSGRLNKKTIGYRFVRPMSLADTHEEFTHKKNVIRGKLAKTSDFVVLYSGGYNTWVDVKTLFSGLEKAMSKNPNIVFVSTGGAIEGHDEFTYNQFQEMINNSRFKDRFHLCGWVPKEDLPNYYLESDLAINSDIFCYEAILGSRNRMIDWLRADLPFISTPLSEITKFLIEKDVAYSFEENNPGDLASKLIDISSKPEVLKIKREKIKQILKNNFSHKVTMTEFSEWLKNPKHAPDFRYNKKFANFLDSESNVNNYVPSSHRLAFFLWPFVSKPLRFLGMKSVEEKIKKSGEKIFFTRDLPYNLKFLEVKIPQIIAGKKTLFTVTVKNTGESTWKTHKESEKAINLSYHWKNMDDSILIKDGLRTPLPHSIKEGEKITLNGELEGPKEPGKYILEIDMIKENDFWFSEQNSKPFRITLDVKQKNT